MFVQTYRGNIRPLNGSSMWPKTNYTKPLPPIAKRMPGRPKVKRRKHVTEDDGGYKRLRARGGTKICTNYWEQYRNKRTCKNPQKPPPPKVKKKMGRPFKTAERPNLQSEGPNVPSQIPNQRASQQPSQRESQKPSQKASQRASKIPVQRASKGQGTSVQKGQGTSAGGARSEGGVPRFQQRKVITCNNYVLTYLS